MARRSKNYPAEFRERAISLCLDAIVGGWSVAKFAKLAKIPRITVLSWLQSDMVFDRYKRAMEQKALDFPVIHSDLIKWVIEGRPVRDPKTGEIKYQPLDPKAARVAMQGLEFRMMREIKAIYRTETQVNHKHSLEDMSDSEVDAKFEELLARAKAQKKDPDDAGPSVH